MPSKISSQRIECRALALVYLGRLVDAQFAEQESGNSGARAEPTLIFEG